MAIMSILIHLDPSELSYNLQGDPKVIKEVERLKKILIKTMDADGRTPSEWEVIIKVSVGVKTRGVFMEEEYRQLKKALGQIMKLLNGEER